MGLLKRKLAPEFDTETTLSKARLELAHINAQVADHDAERDARLLDGDRAGVDKAEAAIAHARKDAERCERKIILLEDRAVAEAQERRVKAQSELIDRVEAKLAERDEHAAKLAKHLKAAVSEFRLAMAANGAVAAGWPFDAADLGACLIGRSFVAHTAFELYQLSGSPFIASHLERQWEFPGAISPSIVDPSPESISPLTDKLREASAYASLKMRGAPVRALPLSVTAAKPTPIIASPTIASAAKPSDAPPAKAVEPEYAFDVDFVRAGTGEQRTEQIVFGADEIAEASLDGLGPAGALGRDIALRMATERAPADFVFAGKPNSIRLDIDRLSNSINKD